MKLISSVAVLIFLISCNDTDKKEKKASIPKPDFIQTPIKDVDIPYEEYSIDAEKGDTLFYYTGSIVLFPPNSFVDKDGNIVKGNVKVKYREFVDPLDFYLSGIPMSYDSAGTQYSFESAGMCEVLAFKDNLPVFVNPKSKPEINIVTKNPAQDQALYFLDTVQRKWVNKGKSLITDLSKKNNQTRAIANFYTEIIEPFKPEKVNNKSPVIKIAIDPGSFKELLTYDNLQFQLDPDEKSYNPKDSAEEWTDVELLKGSGQGVYIVKFSNATRTVSYNARPVLEGKDYEKALKVFEKKNKDYQEKKAQRLLEERSNKQKYIEDSIAYIVQLEENKRIERLNAIIERRNKEIEKQNALYEKMEKQIIDARLSNSLMRSFEIDGFGIWNCDKLISITSYPVVAMFQDTKGNEIELNNIAVLYNSFNGIIRFSNNRIKLVKDADNMIIGVYNGRFAYIPYDDFRKLQVNSDTKEQVFIMTVVDEKNNNYDFIKSISGRQ